MGTPQYPPATLKPSALNNPTKRKQFLDSIDSIPGLNGIRVVYFNGATLEEIRPHPPICIDKQLTLLIRPVTANEEITIQTPRPNDQQRDSRFYTELTGATLSCGAAVISWLVIGGSGAAIPITGGASATVTVLTWGAAAASTAQCGNAIFRLANETDYGNAQMNDWLDSQVWYQQTLTALDVVSVLGAAAAAGATLKMAIQLNKSGTPMKAVLQGLSRQQRKALTEDIIRANNPNISNKALKALVAAQKYPKRFTKVELSNTVKMQLKDTIGATFSFAGSATGGILRDPSRIPEFAVALIEEFEAI